MGQNPKCPELRKDTRRQVKIYLRRVFLHRHRRCWPTPNSGSMLGQHCSPLLVQCWSIVYDAGPTLIYHRVCWILLANTWHSTNAVSLLTYSFQRWPVIETALGDCTVLTAALCWWRFNIPAPETPDNTIHWPNADVMPGHRLRRWANIITTKTLWVLNNRYNRDFFEHLLKTKVLNLRTWNVMHMFIRTGVQNMNRFPNTNSDKNKLDRIPGVGRFLKSLIDKL